GVALAVTADVLGGTVVALLGTVDDAVAAEQRAGRRATAASRAVDDAVVATLAEGAGAGAMPVAGAVRRPLVAGLAVGDDTVAAVRREHATGSAHLGRAVAAEVRAVVALLRRILDDLVAAV